MVFPDAAIRPVFTVEDVKRKLEEIEEDESENWSVAESEVKIQKEQDESESNETPIGPEMPED